MWRSAGRRAGGGACASGAGLGRPRRAGALRASQIGGLVGVATSRDAIKWAERGSYKAGRRARSAVAGCAFERLLCR